MGNTSSTNERRDEIKRLFIENRSPTPSKFKEIIDGITDAEKRDIPEFKIWKQACMYKFLSERSGTDAINYGAKIISDFMDTEQDIMERVSRCDKTAIDSIQILESVTGKDRYGRAVRNILTRADTPPDFKLLCEGSMATATMLKT